MKPALCTGRCRWGDGTVANWGVAGWAIVSLALSNHAHGFGMRGINLSVGAIRVCVAFSRRRCAAAEGYPWISFGSVS
jgi:hypothetical protein